MTKRNQDKKLRLKNVASADETDETFMYNCKINNQDYICELDTAASDIFLPLSAAQKMKLPIKPRVENIILGNGTSVKTAGTARATIQVGSEYSEEEIILLAGEDTGILILGRSWGKKHQPALNWKDYSMVRTRNDGTKVRILPRNVQQSKDFSIRKMSFKKMAREIRRGNCELFMARLVNNGPEADQENINSVNQVKSDSRFKKLINEYADVFRQELPDELPPKRAFEFEIRTDPTQSPASRPVIRLSYAEQQELKRQLDGLLKKGLIRHSTSPYGAPVFFIKKREGDLRMVCDYRGLNKMTIKDANPLPLIEETLDQLAEAVIFSRFDLVGAYHQLRIKEEDIHKTAIRTRFGSFEWRVLCFGLTNAPAAFTRLAADIFKEFNGDFLAFYLDDVIIYSKSIEEHLVHVRKFLELLRKHKLLAKGSKCEVGQKEVFFLGQFVSEGKIRMDDSLVKAVEEWPTPTCEKDVQKFLGLSGYYRKFIRGYADIARPISDLIRSHRFRWEEDQQSAFQNLKQALTSRPVLSLPKIGLPFRVTTDASKFAVGATLEQEGHPVAYLSHRLSDAETKWHTGDQELLAFLIALQKWDVYLKGVQFQLKTDHEPIRYLQSKPRLSPRQQRWLDVFQDYDFDITHVKGTENIAADALSRRVDLKKMCKEVPKIAAKIMEAQKSDNFTIRMKAKLERPEELSEKDIEKNFRNFEIQNDVLVWNGSGDLRIFVPKVGDLRKEIVREYHKTAHLGTAKIYASVADSVYWKNMYEDIKKWCASCRTCLANKIERSKKPGLLQPHLVPSRCWEHITADFVTEFPTTDRGHDAVLVVVDKLSKRVVLVPMKKSADSEEVAHLFESHVFSKFGVPEKLTSDRDSKFTAKYWKTIMEANVICLNMATKDHPETDGQSERSIQTLIGVLQPTIQKEPKDWDRYLPAMEFELNSSRQESTKLTPFEIDIGRIPRKPLTREIGNLLSNDDTAIDFLERQKIFTQVAKDHLHAARESQRYFADRDRKDRNFKPGDWVMLQAKGTGANQRADLPTKWQPKFLGPVEVLEKIGEVSYRVELPPSMARAHNVVHVSRLKPFVQDDSQTDVNVIVDPDGTVEQAIETIMDHTGSRRNREYLVKFAGDTDSEAVWMTKKDLKNARDLVKAYEQKIKGTVRRGRPPKVGASVTISD